jgi:sialate O-acetylesterase
MKNLILSPVISDGMVIQRDSPFPIRSGKKITVSFLGKTYKSVSKNEKWLVTLDPVKAGGPFKMEIASEDSSFEIQDIYSGDIWLCSGQSNMEMQMSRLRDDFAEEWELADHKEQKSCFPLIRQFKAPQEWDFSGPREDYTGGSWLIPSKDTLHEFAATPWFFARNLYEKYKVPIGLIITPWGGTPVESWMSADALSGYTEKIAEGKQYADPLKREEITGKNTIAINEWEINLAHEDTGTAKQWEKTETDISAWNDITLPGNFYESSQNDPELNKFCGVIWLCKEFEAGENFACKNAKVWLGTIIDSDRVYINGTEIGNTGYRYPPRKYVPKELIKQGKNRIVIRVVCNSGEGGITADKPFRVFTDNESAELSGTWKYKIGAKVKERPEEFFYQRLPTGNYNAMIAPILKYPLKGVIWYQGESNESAPYEYEKLFISMINDWRKKSGNNELPFLFVQLPIFGALSDNNEKHRWAVIREAQKNALSLPATGMAAALEFGEWNDIHPINKRDVAYRLFLAAEKTVFGVNNTSPGPMTVKYEIKNKKLEIYFDNCGEGLITEENLPRTRTANFQFDVSFTNQHERKQQSKREDSQSNPFVSIIGDEGQFRLPVTISGKDCVIIDMSTVKNPQRILYAWADNPRDRQLFNSEGLPVIPFRIDIKGNNCV